MPRRPMGYLWAGVLGVAAIGCMSGPPVLSRGYPLYPGVGGGPLPVDQVARLGVRLPVGAAPGGGATAFIKSVDGREVSSLDSVFELAPGCHVVDTQSQIVIANENMTWSGVVGSRAFVFQMKPGYQYVVVVEMREGMSGSASLSIFATEHDGTGKQVAAVDPVAPGTAANACSARPR